MSERIAGALEHAIAEGFPDFMPRAYEGGYKAALEAAKAVDDGDKITAERVAQNIGATPGLSNGQKETIREVLCGTGRNKHRIGLSLAAWKSAVGDGEKQRTKLETLERELDKEQDRATQDAGLPGDFLIDGDWVGVEKETDRGAIFIPVCTKFQNVGALYDETGHGLGHLLEFTDELGVSREIAYQHHETVQDSGAFLGRMAKKNMRFKGGEEAHKLAGVLFADMPNGDPILNASRAGWHIIEDKRVFVPMVGKVIGGENGTGNTRVRLQEKARVPKLEPTGSIEGWQGQVRMLMELCDFHSTVILSAAFAGTILSLLRIPSCGIAPTGGTSIGKSLVMKYGAAVWGLVREGAGAFIDLRGTDNGMEGIAAKLTAHTAMLDEFRNCDARKRQDIIFMLAHELSKTRADTDQGLRARLVWSLYFVISAEKEIEKLIAEGGQTKAGGVERRLVETDCTGMKSSQDSPQSTGWR